MSRSQSVVAGRILCSVVVAAFACTALANGLDRISRNAPAIERLVPDPFRAQADRAAAATAFERGDNVTALARSRDAVATDPVDPDATAWLGSALMQVGRTQDAVRTFRVAAKFGWRNVQTQAFWYDAALQAGDFEVAAERVDALLRVHPRLLDQTEFLKPMESDPIARKALVERLQLRPGWLVEYLNVADEAPSDVIDGRLAVLTELDSSRLPIGCDAVTPFTRALLDNGRRHDAERLWNGNCPDMKVAGLLADPNFAHVLDPDAKSPFSWRVMSSGDLAITQGPSGARPGGLTLTNSAPGTRLALIQTVALPAGRYRFHVDPGSSSSTLSGKLYVSWACNGRPPFPDTSSGNLLGTGQEISVTECDRQQIGLWVGGGGASAQLQSITFEKVG
jgi:tetratricopeptide (TPR) repeat protein